MVTKKGFVTRIAALACIAVFALGMLSGCSAVVEDPVVAQVGDIKVYYSDYYSVYSTYSMYAGYLLGIDTSTAEGKKQYQDWVMNMVVDDAVLEYKVNELNIELNDEDLEKAQQGADEAFESVLNGYKSKIDSAITDENEIREAELKLLLKELEDAKVSLDEYKERILEKQKEQTLKDKLIDQVKAEVSLEDGEAKKWYDEQLEEQTKTYTEKPEEYYTAYSSAIGSEDNVKPLFIPEGYIRVKHIFIKAPESDENKTTEDNSSYVELTADFDAKVAEVEQKLAEGVDFDELIETYGDDPGMQNDPYKEEGYLVHESIKDKYYEGWAEAALELKNVGDVSKAVKTEKGIHFIKLIEKVESRTLSFEEVEEAISAKLLKAKQDEHYSETLAAWVEAAPIKKYMSRVRYVG